MSARRLPEDSFERYVALGEERSYALLAERLGVSKRAVTKRASKEGWAERLARIEHAARERSDERMVDAISEMHERHLATIRAMNMRALAALKEYPLASGMEAVKAAEIAIKLERLVAGEASERAVIDVAAVTREEMQRLLTVAPVQAGGGGGENGEPMPGDGQDW